MYNYQNEKARAANAGVNQHSMYVSYTTDERPARHRWSNLSPRRQHLCVILFSHLIAGEIALDEKKCRQLAGRIGCTSADVLRAADDLWEANQIAMRMLGGTAYISKGVGHAR